MSDARGNEDLSELVGRLWGEQVELRELVNRTNAVAGRAVARVEYVAQLTERTAAVVELTRKELAESEARVLAAVQAVGAQLEHHKTSTRAELDALEDKAEVTGSRLVADLEKRASVADEMLLARARRSDATHLEKLKTRRALLVKILPPLVAVVLTLAAAVAAHRLGVPFPGPSPSLPAAAHRDASP